MSFSCFFSQFSQVFRSFRAWLGPVRTCSDLFGPVLTHSDAFGCIRMRSETFGKFSKNFGKFDRKLYFSSFWQGFGGARGKPTSKSASVSNFAPDTRVLRSVRPEIVKKKIASCLRQPYRYVWCLVWALAMAFDLFGGVAGS